MQQDRERCELDRRLDHHRSYPPSGVLVVAIPHGHVIVPYRATRDCLHGGIQYRPSGSRLVVVAPPIGLTVSVLPTDYSMVWDGGVPESQIVSKRADDQRATKACLEARGYGVR